MSTEGGYPARRGLTEDLESVVRSWVFHVQSLWQELPADKLDGRVEALPAILRGYSRDSSRAYAALHARPVMC